jgi:hypothetical protein
MIQEVKLPAFADNVLADAMAHKPDTDQSNCCHPWAPPVRSGMRLATLSAWQSAGLVFSSQWLRFLLRRTVSGRVWGDEDVSLGELLDQGQLAGCSVAIPNRMNSDNLLKLTN